ncbi:MAG TPA: HyaD/HybD family hydrogenase maturation endopeptidase [Nitrospiria bacterium]
MTPIEKTPGSRAMEHPSPRVLVLGIGNILMQDDGIGVWAVRALAESASLPPNVRLLEGGIAGLRLLPEIAAADEVLIIDAARGDGPPGAIYRYGNGVPPGRRGPVFSAHEVGIAEVLAVAELTGRCPRARIIGVQPQETDRVGLQMSPALQAVLPRVIEAAVGELEAMGVAVVLNRKPEGRGIEDLAPWNWEMR